MEKPNLIFIVMDALRARNLSCYRYSKKTSPNIDKLAEKGVIFTSAFASNNSTARSFFSIHTGRHIIPKSLHEYDYSKEELKNFRDSGGKFLQEILKENGYKTICLKNLFTWRKIGFDYYFKSVSEVKKFPRDFLKKFKTLFKFSKSFYNNAFSRFPFYYFISEKHTKNILERKDSEKVTQKAIDVVKSEKSPFFLRIDFDDTHTPYISQGDFQNKFKTEEKSENLFYLLNKKGYSKRWIKYCRECFPPDIEINQLIARYNNAIAYNDYLINKIIKTLRENNILDKTIIFFFSDHGESFNEHEIYFLHNGLYDVSLNIPLIIFGKDIPNKQIESFVQLEDLTPTVLDLAGIKYDPESFDGKSLFPLINGEKEKLRDFVFAEENLYLKKRAIRNKKYKYMESDNEEEARCTICNSFHQGIRELYDLEKDPEEKDNIIEKNPDLAKYLKLQMNKTIKEFKQRNEKLRIKKILSKKQ
jgi:arylsulfatase